MEIAILKSNYISALKAYEVSVNKFLSGRKKISIILFLGAAISLSLFVTFFLSPPIRHGNSIQDLKTGMTGFIVVCLCAIGGIIFALQAREVPVFNDILVQPNPLSENDYEHALEDVNGILDEGNELIKQQKELALWSLVCYLASDLMFIILMITWTD